MSPHTTVSRGRLSALLGDRRLLRDRGGARDVIELGRLAAEHGLVDLDEGNASVKRQEVLYITAAGASLSRLDRGQVVCIDQCDVRSQGQQPTKDIVAHRVLYREHPSATAVLHIHGQYIAAFCALREDRVPVMSSALAMCTALPIPMLPYSEPKIRESEDIYVAAASSSPVILQRNHGLYVAAANAREAVFIAATLEQNLKLFFIAAGCGRPVAEVAPHHVARLQRSREVMRRMQHGTLAHAAQAFNRNPAVSTQQTGGKAGAE